jgi:voltage-gated potassium channel
MNVVIDASTRKDRAAARAVRYDHWVARTTRLLDALALIFLIDFLFSRVAPNGPPWWQPTLNTISFLIWLAFAVDYGVRLSLSPERWPFVRTHKLDLLMVALPMLRMLRVVLLLRKSFRSIPTERIAGSLISIVVGVVVIGAFLEWRVEYNAPGANITTLGLALWWAIVTTTTVGYGDTYPVTTAGRLIGSVIMVVGIGLIGTVSATVAAWFVSHKQQLRDDATKAKADQAKADRAKTPAVTDTAVTDTAVTDTAVTDTAVVARTLTELTAQIEALATQQAQLRATIERLTEQRSA